VADLAVNTTVIRLLVGMAALVRLVPYQQMLPVTINMAELILGGSTRNHIGQHQVCLANYLLSRLNYFYDYFRGIWSGLLLGEGP
jgi:hypothetical protein